MVATILILMYKKGHRYAVSFFDAPKRRHIMPTLNKTATTVKEMLQDITTFLIDDANFTAGNAWKLLRPAAVTEDTTEVILCGVGDGKDEIYIGMKIKDADGEQENFLLNGFCGYDEHLEWFEQPGAIYRDTLPCMTFARDVRMMYWVTANTSRVTIHVEMSNRYEAAYLGFFIPVAVERQYPYPMAIGGSAYDGVKWSDKDTGHSVYTTPRLFNGYSSLCVRRPDGVWRYGGKELMVWPTDIKPVDTLTVYKKAQEEASMEDHMLFPMLLYESDPVGILGQFDGLYWIGNRADLAVKDTVLYKDKPYKIFNNVFRRDDDEYHAVEWA